MMEIIDFHMHPYLSGEEFSCMYPEVFSPSPGQMKEDVTSAGISHVCGSVIEVGKYTKEEGFAAKGNSGRFLHTWFSCPS